MLLQISIELVLQGETRGGTKEKLMTEIEIEIDIEHMIEKKGRRLGRLRCHFREAKKKESCDLMPLLASARILGASVRFLESSGRYF